MFRKRIGDQSESKIDSDKYLLKKIKLDLPGHGEGLFCLNTLLNAVIDLDQFKLTIVCFRTYKAGAATLYNSRGPRFEIGRLVNQTICFTLTKCTIDCLYSCGRTCKE